MPAETPHLPCRAGRGSPFAGIAAGRRPGRLLGRTLSLDVATPELSRSEGLQTDRTMVKRRGSTGSTSTGAPFVERIGQEGFQRSTNSKAEEGNKRQRGSGVAPFTIPPAFLRRTEKFKVYNIVADGSRNGEPVFQIAWYGFHTREDLYTWELERDLGPVKGLIVVYKRRKAPMWCDVWNTRSSTARGAINMYSHSDLI